MTREEKQKAIDALKISAPIMAVTQEEFNDYIQTLNKVMDWLEKELFINKPCIAEKLCEHYKWMALDKIRAEIESITPKAHIRTGKLSIDTEFELMIPLGKVLNVIDKYKADRSVEDGNNAGND